MVNRGRKVAATVQREVFCNETFTTKNGAAKNSPLDHLAADSHGAEAQDYVAAGCGPAET